MHLIVTAHSRSVFPTVLCCFNCFLGTRLCELPHELCVDLTVLQHIIYINSDRESCLPASSCRCEHERNMHVAVHHGLENLQRFLEFTEVTTRPLKMFHRELSH